MPDLDSLPPCGLYRTGMALVGQEDNVPKGILIMFHNHSDQGPPIVLRPVSNEHNRWEFHKSGWSVQDPGFIKVMVPLKAEGLYTVTGQIYVERERRIAERSLVQLGYNRNGDSILFLADFVGNSIHFPSQGFRFTNPSVQANLKKVPFSVPVGKTLH